MIWVISSDQYDMAHIVWSVLHDRYKFPNLVDFYRSCHISINRRYKILYTERVESMSHIWNVIYQMGHSDDSPDGYIDVVDGFHRQIIIIF